MMFSSLATSAVAALSLAALPGAMADSNLARGLDIKLRWHNSNNCRGGGPIRDYSRGTCLDLSDDTRGVEILDRSGRCYLVSYDDGRCTRNGRKLDDNGCWTLKGKNSVAFKC